MKFLLNKCVSMAAGLMCLSGLSSNAQAEIQVIQVPAHNSALLWSNYTIWDCCDVNSISMNPTSMNVHTCSTMGGYCSGGRDIAVWLFELPTLPEGGVILESNLVGRVTSGGGSGSLKMAWTDSQTISVSSGMNTFNNPSASQTLNWPYGNFSIPMNLDENNEAWSYGYVMVTGYRSTSMTFSNSGANAAKIVFLVDVPTNECEADLNGDGYVNVSDMLQLIEAWGPCTTKTCDADIDGDNYVRVSDLLVLIDNWGSCE